MIQHYLNKSKEILQDLRKDMIEHQKEREDRINYKSFKDLNKCKIETTSLKQFLEIQKKHQTIVVKFYTQWCPSCKKLGPFLKEQCNLDRKWALININAEESKEITDYFKIDRVPTIYLFKNQKKVIELENNFEEFFDQAMKD